MPEFLTAAAVLDDEHALAVGSPCERITEDLIRLFHLPQLARLAPGSRYDKQCRFTFGTFHSCDRTPIRRDNDRYVGAVRPALKHFPLLTSPTAPGPHGWPPARGFRFAAALRVRCRDRGVAPRAMPAWRQAGTGPPPARR